jgi:hypothetical protein
LVELMRSRAGLTYTEPAGLRSAAEDALALIENRPSSARLRASNQATEKSSARFDHPRRYVRVRLTSPLAAKLAGPHGATAVVRVMALGGAMIETNSRLNIGESVQIEIRSGLRRIVSTAVVRSASTAGYGIEFVHMKQEDRENLRRHVGKLLR